MPHETDPIEVVGLLAYSQDITVQEQINRIEAAPREAVRIVELYQTLLAQVMELIEAQLREVLIIQDHLLAQEVLDTEVLEEPVIQGVPGFGVQIDLHPDRPEYEVLVGHHPGLPEYEVLAADLLRNHPAGLLAEVGGATNPFTFNQKIRI